MVRLLAPLAALLLLLLPTTSRADSIVVDGRERDYLLRLPPGEGRAPLLLVLHGGGGRGRQIERHSDLTGPALAAGFAVAYPDGIGRQWNDGRADLDAEAVRDGVDDVAFLLALVDRLAAEGKVDPARVFVTGISNGGIMSFRLACEAAGRVAGVVTIVANLGVEVAGRCHPSRPVPLLMLNGTADELVRYQGGPVVVFGKARGSVIGTEATLAIFGAANGCGGFQPAAIADPADDGVGVEALAGQGCAAPTRLVRYVGGGHGWPGKGKAVEWRETAPIPEAPAANDLILGFLAPLAR
jgi:polyhydroxybutyrate depolymerase